MKEIRKAALPDLEAVMMMYADARRFMRATGNMTQWEGGYPSENVVRADMEKGCLYICEEDGVMLGVFYFAEESDPTYAVIEEGAWQNDAPYAVIHRVAVSRESHGKGVAGFIFDTCFERCSNIKIDTHRDNIPMQRALTKKGFQYCGIIHLANGDERLAYQRC